MTDTQNPGIEINLDARVVRPRDFYCILRNQTTCLNLNFVKFTFRILILFGFVNSSNFTWVIMNLEKGSSLTRRQIHGWLKNISVKLEKEKKNEPLFERRPCFNASYSFGGKIGKYLDATCEPCACRLLKGTEIECGVLEKGKCVCLQIVDVLIDFVSRRDFKLLRVKKECDERIRALTGWSEKSVWSGPDDWEVSDMFERLRWDFCKFVKFCENY